MFDTSSEPKYTSIKSGVKSKDNNTLAQIKKDWTYTIENDTVLIKSYKGSDIHVVVPSYISGKPVTQIETWAFSSAAPRIKQDLRDRRKVIKSITLPQKLKEFYISDNNPLTPGCLDTDAETIIIPEGCEDYSIELLHKLSYFFDSNLEGVSNTGKYTIIGKCILTNDEKTLVGINDKRNVEKLSIPESIGYIYGNTLGCCLRLNDLKLCSWPKQISRYTEEVSYCSLSSIEKLRTLRISKVPIIEKDMFSHCIKLKEIVLGDGVKEIKEYAFSELNHLSKVTIPECCTSIGENVFSISAKYEINKNAATNGLPERLTICCKKNSVAEKYAQANGIAIEYIDN